MTGRERWWLYLVAGAASGLTLGLVGILPAVPRIQEELDIPTSQIGWFTTVYLVPTVILTLPAGVLMARWNPGRLFGPILIVYGLAGMAQAAVSTYAAILPFRALQGVCVALAMPMTITLIADIFEEGRQIRALSVRQIVLTLSGVVWPLVGTTLATFAWQGPFLLQGIVLPIGLILILRPPPAIRTLADQRIPLSTLLLEDMRRESVAASVLALNFARYFFLFAVIVYLPVLVVTQEGHSLTQAGLLIATLSAVSAVASERMERMAAAVRSGTLAIASCLFVGAGLVALGVTAQYGWAILGACILFGIGDGIWGVLGDSYVARLWQGEVRRAMAAVVQTFRNAGKLLGPLVVGALLLVGSLPVAFVIVGAAACALVIGLVPLRALDAQAGRPADAI